MHLVSVKETFLISSKQLFVAFHKMTFTGDNSCVEIEYIFNLNVLMERATIFKKISMESLNEEINACTCLFMFSSCLMMNTDEQLRVGKDGLRIYFC